MNAQLSQVCLRTRLPIFALFFSACLAAALTAPAANAQSTQAAGIVIFKATNSDTPQYYDGAVFKTLMDIGAWLSFDIGQERPLKIEKGFIVNVIDFNTGAGNVFTMNILNDSDAQQIAVFSEQLKAQTAAMPKLLKLVKSTTSLLENQLSMYKSGNVRKDGRWIDKTAWEREQSNKMKSSFVIAGISYVNPRFISAKDETIAFAHDGGIAKIPFKKLDQTSRTLIASTFKIDPAVFGSSGSASPGSSAGPMDRTPGAYLTEKMSRIIFPTFQMQGATLEEAIEYLRIKSRDLDTFSDESGVKGVNVILRQGDAPSNVAISLDLKNVPMLEALRFITELAQMKFRVEAHAVLVVPPSEETSIAMTGTPAGSTAPASNRPAPAPGPRIPVLPASMALEAIGSGGSESEALLDAQFNAVAAVLEEHVSSTAGDWKSKFTVRNVGYDSARASDDYRKIAMRKRADGVNLIIETKIPREKLVPILLKLGFVE
jgi:hypothetical protein